MKSLDGERTSLAVLSVHVVPIMRAISAATSSASSADSVVQPSWCAWSQRSPVPNSVVCCAQLSWLRSRPS